MRSRDLGRVDAPETGVRESGETVSDYVDAGLVLPRRLATGRTAGPAPGTRSASDGSTAPDLADWRPPAAGMVDPRMVAAAGTLLAGLDQDGLAGAVLQCERPADGHLLMDIAAHAPQRLRAVLPLPARRVVADVPRLMAHGLVGFSFAGAPSLDVAWWGAMLRPLAAHGLHLHLDVPPESWDALLPVVLGQGVPVRLALPRTADHLCRAWGAFRVLERHAADEHLWIGFVPVLLRAQGLGRLVDRLLEVAGPERLVWASGRDSERRGHGLAEQVAALDDLLPDPQIRAAIAGSNARCLAFGRPRPKREH